MLILIDSGASHNIISTPLVSRLGLKAQQTRPYEVTVGNGSQVQGPGVCKEVTMEIQGLQLQQSFYLSELGGVDIVLGIEWLESLGKVKVNWQPLTMRIERDSKVICLRGDPLLSRTLVSLKPILKSANAGEQGSFEFEELTMWRYILLPNHNLLFFTLRTR